MPDVGSCLNQIFLAGFVAVLIHLLFLSGSCRSRFHGFALLKPLFAPSAFFGCAYPLMGVYSYAITI
jgi:hypothetical protein